MKFGMILPGGTAPEQVEQAVLAEQAGWDAVFVWEAAYGVDAWTLLAAMAMRTERVQLGTMLTPIPWRRPWKLAGQVATLDQLSAGRAIVTVGLGAVDPQLPSTGEEEDRRIRASMMDEGIDLMRALWEGAGEFTGEHYTFAASDLDFIGGAQPSRRIPIWVAARWPRPKSMRRVLRCDGIVPEGIEVEQLPEMIDWLTEHGARPDLDVTTEGQTPIDDPRAAADRVAPWAAAGSNWWLESQWTPTDQGEPAVEYIGRRIEAGPPRP